jgi:peptidyl-prolyl cis-trans isomerase A (cyclophilin A)
MIRLLMAALAVTCLLLVGCAEEPAEEPAKPPAEAPPAEPPEEAPAEKPKPEPPKVEGKKALMNPSALKEKAPDTFMVKFDTGKGDILVQVTRSWAPRGADRFYNLVKNGFYDDVRFFRVMPNFIVQFGLPADPAVGRLWATAHLRDDPVTKTNRKGAVVFAMAGPNTRTTQVFINLKANAFLDSQGFAPFGLVVEGMDVVEQLHAGYGEAPDQSMIRNQGNAYLSKRFPKLDYIKQATIE